MVEWDPEGFETDWLQDFVDLRGRRVLEIGSGNGRLTWRIAAGLRSVVGIDVDEGFLAEARLAGSPELGARAEFVAASGDQLPFASQSFEAAILAWSL